MSEKINEELGLEKSEIKDKTILDNMKDDSNVVVEEIEYQKNSIFHLQRSNQEMLEFDPNDKDFMIAIEENTKIITIKNKRITELEEFLPKTTQDHYEEGIDL